MVQSSYFHLGSTRTERSGIHGLGRGRRGIYRQLTAGDAGGEGSVRASLQGLLSLRRSKRSGLAHRGDGNTSRAVDVAEGDGTAVESVDLEVLDLARCRVSERDQYVRNDRLSVDYLDLNLHATRG